MTLAMWLLFWIYLEYQIVILTDTWHHFKQIYDGSCSRAVIVKYICSSGKYQNPNRHLGGRGSSPAFVPIAVLHQIVCRGSEFGKSM